MRSCWTFLNPEQYLNAAGRSGRSPVFCPFSAAHSGSVAKHPLEVFGATGTWEGNGWNCGCLVFFSLSSVSFVG